MTKIFDELAMANVCKLQLVSSEALDGLEQPEGHSMRTREMMVRRMADEILKCPDFFTQELIRTPVETVTTRLNCIVLTPDEFEKVITESFNSGVSHGSRFFTMK